MAKKVEVNLPLAFNSQTIARGVAGAVAVATPPKEEPSVKPDPDENPRVLLGE